MIDRTVGDPVASEQQQLSAAVTVEEALARLSIGSSSSATVAVDDDDESNAEQQHENTGQSFLEIVGALQSKASESATLEQPRLADYFGGGGGGAQFEDFSEVDDESNAKQLENTAKSLWERGDALLSTVSSSSETAGTPDEPWLIDHWEREGGGAPFEVFSDAELAAALRNLGIEDVDESNGDLLDFPSSTGELPELEFTGDDDPLLISFEGEDANNENLLDVFDENFDEEEQVDPALDILEQLELLTLLNEGDIDEGPWLQTFQDPREPVTPVSDHRIENLAAAPFHFAEGDTADDDDPWIYCQPCNSPSAIPPPIALSSSEDLAWEIAAAAVLAEQLEREGTEDREEDAAFWREQIALLRGGSAWGEVGKSSSCPPDPFELLHLDKIDADNTIADEVRPYLEKVTCAESTELSVPVSEEETLMQLSLRPEARRAAQPFAVAFGTSVTMVENAGVEHNNPKIIASRLPQRECLGHKERILGCEFSLCGKFLATASQDSTVRLWSTATHRQLTVLEGHSTEHECLRVAWASPAWAQDQIQRRRPKKDEMAASSVQSYAYLLASGGADGVVHLWGCDNPETDPWTNFATLDHSTYSHVKNRSKASDGLEKIEEEEDEEEEKEGKDEDDKPQIYSLQFIDHWMGLPSRSKSIGGDVVADDEDKATNSNNSFLLTSSDDHVHLWEIDEAKLNKKTKGCDGAVSKQLQLREVLSLRFGPLQGPAYGVTVNPVTENSILTRDEQHQPLLHDSMCPNSSVNRFGGDRNPDNIIFVFDASYCPANGLLGAALSDGTLRLMNGRGVCMAVLQLPGCQSHLTSFNWDSTGERLATTVATGHLITWGIELSNIHGSHGPSYHHSLVSEGIRAYCRCVMEGGHDRGRPLYGTRYLENDNLLISWGGDGRVCLWDSHSAEEIDGPLAVLWDNNNDRKGDGYPVFALSITPKKVVGSSTDGNAESKSNNMLSIAIAGGGTTGGFLGIPVIVQDVNDIPDDDDEELQGDAKRPKQGG